LRLIGDIGSGGLLGAVSAYRNGIEIYKGVIDAAANRGKAKILSRPNLMTSDNRKRACSSARKCRSSPRSPAATSRATRPRTSCRASVPRHGAGDPGPAPGQLRGLVNLELSLEISEVAPGESAGGIQSPTFTTRKPRPASSSTAAKPSSSRHHRRVDQRREGGRSLPDGRAVPGPLFRGTSTSRRRVELIVLITPFVVRDRDEARSVTRTSVAAVEGCSRTSNSSKHAIRLPTP